MIDNPLILGQKNGRQRQGSSLQLNILLSFPGSVWCAGCISLRMIDGIFGRAAQADVARRVAHR
jgi:hypothetical protein